MAIDILSRYGIKEVADVTFYEIDSEGNPGAPVLYLDTLKVSTIEQTAENTSARGGKGNPELIMWDYGKEITLTLEDALFSAKSMALMYGVKTDADSEDFAEMTADEYILKTVRASEVKDSGIVINGTPVTPEEITYYTDRGEVTTAGATEEGKIPVYATCKIKVAGQKIVISSDNFPGTYYVTGDTYARSETTGKDEFFQFIVPKAKMQSEVTLTMEAEGDPSTFNMTMKVLRPQSGEMMKLVKYNLPENDAETALG